MLERLLRSATRDHSLFHRRSLGAPACVIAAACAAIAVAPPLALGHQTQATGSTGVKGMTEKQLRAWETTVLGPAHAQEHAQERRAARQLQKAMRDPALRARYRRAQRAARLRAHKADALPPAQYGRWTPAFDTPVFAVNAAMLPTGKVLWYAYPAHPYAGTPYHYAIGYLWDPSKGTGSDSFTRVDPPIDKEHPHNGQYTSANIWCTGTSFLADGRVLVTGGNLLYGGDNGGGVTSKDYAGLNKVYTFNPFNQTWTEQPDMAHGRWYPSQLLMPNGSTMIIRGLDEKGQGVQNKDVEVFTPSANLNGRGKISYAGPVPGGAIYPHMFWMPSGHGLIAGPFSEDTWRFSPFAVGRRPAWSNYADFAASTDRVWGNAVLEPGKPSGGSTKVLLTGGSHSLPDANGNNLPTKTSVVYNETTNRWTAAPPQNIGRSHSNTVLLPDGSMVTVGGGVGRRDTNIWAFDVEQRQVELWNPANGTWKLGPAQNEGRAYHSTALLLPDGRVLSAGDDFNGDPNTSPDWQRHHDTAEIYEPPYLFNGPRPTISSAPTRIGWNTEFVVRTGTDAPANDVTRAVLIAPSSVTHGVDMNQRVVPLQMTGKGEGFRRFRSPPNANIALPGYYMLFLLNAKGVPSVAKWIRLRSGSKTILPSRPTLSAGLVHHGKRMIRVKIGSSTARRARVKLVLRDGEGHPIATLTRTFPTGGARDVSDVGVPARARSVRITLVSLVGSR